MELLGISGSLQSRSANTALLNVARAVAADGVEVVLYDGLDAIPAFNPDREPGPAAVEAFRDLVRSADGLLIATPEYAFGVPGALKNLLDWLVGSGELYGKPVVIVSAAPSAERGVNARNDLERTLKGQGARVLASTTIAVPTSVRGAEIDDPGICDTVAKVLSALTND